MVQYRVNTDRYQVLLVSVKLKLMTIICSLTVSSNYKLDHITMNIDIIGEPILIFIGNNSNRINIIKLVTILKLVTSIDIIWTVTWNILQAVYPGSFHPLHTGYIPYIAVNT